MSTITNSETPPAVADPPRPKPTARRRSIGPLVLRLHFYAGVLVAPFLVVAALTGLAFVFSPQLDGLVYADELRVDVGAAPARPLAEQVTAARGAHPEGDFASVIPPVTATDTTKVVFNLPELGEKQHTVYVDPYTNEVRGTLTTWFGETPLQTWLDDLHRNLHLGVVGRHYSELAASWLWLVVLGGLFLWLRRQWTGRDKLRRTVLPDLAANVGVRRTRSWHAATGVWLAIGLLALSATGLTWSRYAGGNFDILQEGFDSHRPTLDTALPGGSTGGGTSDGGGHHEGGASGAADFDVSDVDRVTLIAREAGVDGKVEVSPPAEPGTAWTVVEDDPAWPYGWDRAAVDPATGTVVAHSRFADWPVLAQLSKLGVAFHMGFLFGIVNQLLLAALAIGLLCVIVWGTGCGGSAAPPAPTAPRRWARHQPAARGAKPTRWSRWPCCLSRWRWAGRCHYSASPWPRSC
ncbi:membrane protein [Phytohabitans flavus]|uniref:Membrane protein n=1 Tax=Phytohabitans flavus TaxID=1076124 RepID=A0A6F8XRT7_9ACTN|nr:PepSY-associated TM helix domain-containing protein [Phytohabitans flavus]BCB76517.1 membrane protein [Phytohabitans flavus]